MRQMVSGLVAAAAVMTVSAAPASACGGLGLFSSCSPCGQAYVSPCGYGAGYEYDHGTEEAFSGQNYFPETMSRENYYRPTERGFEKEIAKRLETWTKLRAAK